MPSIIRVTYLYGIGRKARVVFLIDTCVNAPSGFPAIYESSFLKVFFLSILLKESPGK